MKSTTAIKYFSIPSPHSQDGHIQVAPGDEVLIGNELYPGLPPVFPSWQCVVVVKGTGIGLVDSECVKITK